MQKLKEVKVTNSSNLKNCKNERIMLVSSASKIPFYVFSLLPYKKIKRSVIYGSNFESDLLTANSIIYIYIYIYVCIYIYIFFKYIH